MSSVSETSQRTGPCEQSQDCQNSYAFNCPAPAPGLVEFQFHTFSKPKREPAHVAVSKPEPAPKAASKVIRYLKNGMAKVKTPDGETKTIHSSLLVRRRSVKTPKKVATKSTGAILMTCDRAHGFPHTTPNKLAHRKPYKIRGGLRFRFPRR